MNEDLSLARCRVALGETLPLLSFSLCVCVMGPWEHRDGVRVPGPALGKLLCTVYHHTRHDMAGRASRACDSWGAGHWSMVTGSGAQGMQVGSVLLQVKRGHRVCMCVCMLVCVHICCACVLMSMCICMVYAGTL